MNKLFCTLFISFICLNGYSAEKSGSDSKTDKASIEKANAAKAEELMKTQACVKDQESPECKKFLNKVKVANPCSSDIEKFCKDGEFKDPGSDKIEAAKKMNACLEKNKSSLSKGCSDQLDHKQYKPYNCNDKCMVLKDYKQVECLTKCIISKDKK